ncbi:MAG: dynamin family protein [Cyanobacteria bacterium P01_G01_bin.54]
MSNSLDSQTFLDGLARFAQVRIEVADRLDRMTQTLERSEIQAEQGSGKLALEQEIADLSKLSQNLRQGKFRLLVLGDMKRGKSTFLNALIGENLLPSDVNPCTALLTVLRYGESKTVTVHFNDGSQPEQINFKDFKQRYTIDPAEAKRLETEQKQAFPTVDYAVVDYPLPLLKQGIEIVDSPGLNDTEARNALSLGYINNCHAILFVLRASQPCTLGERRYLENYIKGRGLTIFFLINAWDQVKESLIDPDDPEELAEAAQKLRQVFAANLTDYCQETGVDLYDDRVFEISSLQALRRRVKAADADLSGTGFPEFLAALNVFLTQERAVAELRQARTLARQATSNVQGAIQRRIPLLENDIEELKRRITSVEPEFRQLHQIRDQFQAEIQTLQAERSQALAASFKQYVLSLGDTFEADFLRYQPELGFLDFLSSSKRESFEAGLRQAFAQYFNDKLATWTRSAEQEMQQAFETLATSAQTYGASYAKVTEAIAAKLTGEPLLPNTSQPDAEDAPAWAKWAAGIFSLTRGNLAGVALAGAGFDWKNILLNFVTVLGIGSVITALTGIVLGPIGLALMGFGVGLLQTEQGRREMVKAARREIVKHLPQVADQQSPKVAEAIAECFKTYAQEVGDRINADIQARQAELDNLVKQKEVIEINQGAEIDRLQQTMQELTETNQQVEAIYQQFLVG